jgi:hypothetical protein
MKNKILIFKNCKVSLIAALMIINSFIMLGQHTYGSPYLSPLAAPFITPDKEWVVYFESFTSLIDNGIRTYWFTETKDTIDGVPLYELTYNTPMNSNPIKTKSYYKEKDGQVSKYHDNGDGELTYNFNVQVGDTIARFPSQPLFDLIVKKIDTVVFEDMKPRKRIHLLCELENNRTYYWIEGMGGNDAFLNSDICTIFDSPILGLRCFYENGAKVYQDAMVQDCLISKIEGIENTEKIKIFPNPTLNKIFIQSNFEIKQICIYSQIGKLMVKKEIELEEIDISDLPSGIYNVEVNLKGNRFSREIRRITKI